MQDNTLEKCTLLYIEDDKDIQNTLAQRLQKKVKQLYVASNGEEGFNSYLKYKPDIILTDITMPKLNGIEMSKKIREHNTNIPIIIISAHGDSEYLLEAIEGNITNYLIKPINIKKLFNILESNAKKIYLEKILEDKQEEIQNQKMILQKIIDTHNSMLIVTNFKSITFTNQTFLDFLHISNIKEFEDNHNSILDIFCESSDYLHKGSISCNIYEDHILAGKKFYNLIQEKDETKRVVVILNKELESKSFYINITIIEKEQGLYLISLTDITKIAIEKIAIEQKAYIDTLTGVANRNKFEKFFQKELLRIQRYHTPLSISILDIDYFKKFNDTHGHLIGDKILVLIAKECENNIRTLDFFARWGGEEFIILLPQTKLDEATIAIENIRKRIENIEYQNVGRITCSFGVTQLKENDTLESVFKRCDEALYRAKQKGRNRVEIV